MSEEEKISSAVAFTIITELRDQIKVKDMRIRKLKEKSGKYKDLLQECRPAIVRLVAYDDSEENARIMLLNKINEVLRCGNDL